MYYIPLWRGVCLSMKLLFALTVHFHYSFITTRTRTHIGTNVRIFWIEVVLSLFDWSFACAAHTLANGFNMSSEAVINYWHIKFYILTTKLLYFDDFIIFLAIYPSNKFDDRMWRYERCVCVCVRVVKTVCSRTLVCTYMHKESTIEHTFYSSKYYEFCAKPMTDFLNTLTYWLLQIFRFIYNIYISTHTCTNKQTHQRKYCTYNNWLDIAECAPV